MSEAERPVLLPDLGLKMSAWLECGACLAAEKHPEYAPGDRLQYRACYERLMAPEFVAVVRVHERVDGKIVTRSGVTNVPGSFEAGVMLADVLLLRVEDGAYLAGFPVVGRNSERVSAEGRVEEHHVRQDLTANFEAALSKALAEHLPKQPEQP